ncbi:MAG: hypothetical protein FWG75_00740 [Cystobacterineae bacterium]|nr:hypothetical protein [Cystobacterineae bacterium]
MADSFELQKPKVVQPETIQAIKRNYLNMQQALIDELFMSIEKHAPTLGSHREQVWKSFFERILPKKFTVEQSAFIIDSTGNTSKETDLVIFDEQYTPYIFRNRNIKYIPIEAVMAVVQCKSRSFNKRETKSLNAWLESFDDLNPSTQGWAGTVTPAQVIDNKTPSRGRVHPLRIVCGLFDTTPEKLRYFVSSHNCHLLICARQRSKSCTLNIYRKHERLLGLLKTIIPEWNEEKWKNHSSKSTKCWNIYQNKGAEHELMGLLTLVFELNQYLMCINNPMLFPHQAYVDMFNNEDCNLEQRPKQSKNTTW